jgi:hypothetical protein
MTPRGKLSPLWREILALSQLGQSGRAIILDNDKHISFWKDR